MTRYKGRHRKVRHEHTWAYIPTLSGFTLARCTGCGHEELA